MKNNHNFAFGSHMQDWIYIGVTCTKFTRGIQFGAKKSLFCGNLLKLMLYINLQNKLLIKLKPAKEPIYFHGESHTRSVKLF